MIDTRRLRPAIVVLVASSLAPGLAAKAEAGAADVVYQDLKGVIEELITSEIATTTSTEIVCRAGHVALPDPSADDEARQDVVLVGGKAYQMAALRHYPLTFSYVYRRELGGLRDSIRSESAALAGYLLYESLQRGDHQAEAATTNSVAAQVALVESSARRFGAEARADSETVFADDLGDPCRTAVKARLAAGLVALPSALDEVCAAPSSAQDRLACDLARALQSAVMDDGNAAGYLEAAASVVIAEALRAAFGDMLELGDGFESQVQTYLATVVDRPEDFKDASTALLADALANVVSLKSGTDDVAHRVAAIKAALKSGEGNLRLLAASWRRLAAAAGRGDIVDAVEAIVDGGGPFSALCNQIGATAPVCQGLPKLAGVVGRMSRWMALMRAAGHGDLRQIGAAAFEAILPRQAATDDCEDVQACTRGIYQRFAVSLVYYVIEAAESDNPTEATRASFRAAAVELIRGVSVQGYDRASTWSALYPDLALRAAWSAGNVAQGGDTLRYEASASFAIWRHPWYYTRQVYVATHLSLLDPVAPLAELALRSNEATYHDSEKLAWNVFTPRLDVAIGLPMLSRHLTINGGVALHLVAPYQLDDGSYQYRGYRHDDAAHTRLSQGLQLGVAVNYVP